VWQNFFTSGRYKGDHAMIKAKKKGQEDERGNLGKKIIFENEKEGRDRES
jgi:hypothetical protein